MLMYRCCCQHGHRGRNLTGQDRARLQADFLGVRGLSGIKVRKNRNPSTGRELCARDSLLQSAWGSAVDPQVEIHLDSLRYIVHLGRPRSGGQMLFLRGQAVAHIQHNNCPRWVLANRHCIDPATLTPVLNPLMCADTVRGHCATAVCCQPFSLSWVPLPFDSRAAAVRCSKADDIRLLLPPGVCVCYNPSRCGTQFLAQWQCQLCPQRLRLWREHMAACRHIRKDGISD